MFEKHFCILGWDIKKLPFFFTGTATKRCSIIDVIKLQRLAEIEINVPPLVSCRIFKKIVKKKYYKDHNNNEYNEEPICDKILFAVELRHWFS